MTYHQDADDQVGKFQVRWGCVHETAKEWVARMTTLVECWNKLDGNVGELSSWVTKQVTTIINIGSAVIIVIMSRTPRLWKERPICPLRNWSLN